MKTFFSEVQEFLGNLWGTVKALAKSRKAVLVGAGILITTVTQLSPELGAKLGNVVPTLDVLLGAVAGFIALEDGLKGKGGGQG